MSETPQPRSEAVVANKAWHLAAIILPVAVLAGGLLAFVTDWALSLPWTPLEGPLELLQQIPTPFDTLIPIGVGLVGGVLLLVHALEERMVVRVSEFRLAVRRKEFVREVPRPSIGAVFLDGKHLVVLDRHGAEQLRFRIDTDEKKSLEETLCAYGYPWRADGDPHRDEFRRWVPGMPDLPGGADALLRAREKALEKNAVADIAELHGELAKLGVAVREQDKRQYWRPQRSE